MHRRTAFGLLAAAAASTTLLLSSVLRAHEAPTAFATVVRVAQQIRSAHSRHDYTDLAGTDLVGRTVWGPLIAFSGTAYPDVGSTNRFGLSLNGVPSAACVSFVSSLAPHFEDIWLAGSGPLDRGASVYTIGHLDPIKLAQACREHTRVGLDLITR